MTKEDINDIINAICPNDEDYEKPCISPKYLRQELEQLALDQRQWNGEPTTNNDLGVDKFDKAINQSDLEEWIMETFPDWCEGDVRLIMNHMDEMPSVTPQLSVPEVTALAEWTEKLTKASEDAYNKGYADGMKDQELILDKMRAEIEQARYGLVNDGLDIALNIIDKYKAEMEE